MDKIIEKNIIVTGDVTMDWNLARIRNGAGEDFIWNPGQGTNISWQRGGAALLADLITQVTAKIGADQDQTFSVFQTGAPKSAVYPEDPSYHHSYSLWAMHSDSHGSAWRVTEFLGLDQSPAAAEQTAPWMKIAQEPRDADLVILDDAGMGFRDHPTFWPSVLTSESRQPWILLKMSQPVGSGRLFEHLLEKFADRLIILTTVNDLRLTEVQVSKGLSWERTAQDVIWELGYNPQINAMSRAACVVVSFGTAGAVVHKIASPTSTGGSKENWLIFDPGVIEGEWTARHPGGMIGYTTCLAAGMARHLMRHGDIAAIEAGIQSGLAAMRELHLGGYENLGSREDPRLQFPLERISNCLAGPTDAFAVTQIEDPVRFLSADPEKGERAPESGYWSILQDRYQGNLCNTCEQIVLAGAENSLDDVPQGIFGGLFTVDRQEIESFRSIATLAGEYLSQARPKRPLSIGVFGAPGSGKSFGVTQVAKSLAPGRIEVLEFNLSQFESTQELIAAMHQVRDVNLDGNFPLVFWDEFDTPFEGKPLGWLRYFLAPMQDGAFREGQLVHPIGPAIFVFAGGTSAEMASFGQGLDDAAYRAAKAPDFVSRLKGFVNILGPNPPLEKGKQDPFFMIRRAILLRSILWRNERQMFEKTDGIQLLNIDRGVLRAFLHTRYFKHGIRSMESIVDMSQLAGKKKFARSSLPSEAQLDLHVDGQEFLALVQQIELTEEMLDRLASQFHENFCAMLRAQGYQYGEVTDDQALRHSSLKEFAALSADEQEQNRDTVRHIYEKLAASGYMMIPARSNELPFAFPGPFLEQLATMEHERWVRLKIAQGWQYGKTTDKENKIHADLVPWEELSEPARDKDREFVRAIPQILAKAGYTVVKLRPVHGE